MPGKELKKLLEERVVIFDGAMGTELYRRHQFINVCFEELCLTKPELIKEIYKSYRDAGADAITTNSFSANRIKLAPHLLDDRVVEINAASARIAREAARNYVYVGANGTQ